MDFHHSYYYKLNEFLLSVIGQWPLQKQPTAVIRRIIVSLFCLYSVLVQCATLYQNRSDLINIVRIIPVLSITLAIFSFLVMFELNLDKNKQIFKFMRDDWLLERGVKETKIKESYAEWSFNFTKYMTAFCVIAYIAFVLSSIFYSEILDIILPLNETRQKQTPFDDEYFIDKQKYFYTVLLYICIIAAIIGLICIANQAMFIVHVAHAYGMFDEIGYRLQRTIPRNTCQMNNKERYKDEVYRRNITLCLIRYQKAVEFADILNAYYAPIFGMSSLLTVAMLSPPLAQISDITALPIQAAAEVTGILSYMLIGSFLGQKLIDLSSKISDNIYFSQWYTCSPQIQKLLPIFIMRSAKPCTINAFNVYFLSCQNLRRVFQTVLSYCAVIRSI
ncbi:uncharacterized protein [Prorops nasuta]|uniref:uncharacterized protein n=1 Tax=Prorops nasuta TaxID=863751 RepID=UPI0034CF00C4